MSSIRCGLRNRICRNRIYSPPACAPRSRRDRAEIEVRDRAEIAPPRRALAHRCALRLSGDVHGPWWERALALGGMPIKCAPPVAALIPRLFIRRHAISR